MNFSTPLPFVEPPCDDFSEDELTLHYDILQSTQKQNRFRGQLELRPRLRISDYRCVAVVDWVEIHYWTLEDHQPINIYQDLKNVVGENGPTFNVKKVSRRTENVDNEFHLIVFNPTPQVLESIHQHIVRRWGAMPDMGDVVGRINGIEVSIDFYPDEPSDVDHRRIDLARWRMSRLLRTHLRLPRGVFEDANLDRPRHYNQMEGKTPKLVARRANIDRILRQDANSSGLSAREREFLMIDNHYMIPVDGTVYLGENNSAVYFRIQDKIVDKVHRAKGTAVKLGNREARSRIEVTLNKYVTEQFDLVSVEDLRGFSFETLRRFAFEFCIPTVSVNPSTGRATDMEKEVFRRTGVYGLDGYQHACSAIARTKRARRTGGRSGRRLGRRGYSLGYKDLNDACERALRRLSSSWKPK